MSFCGVLLITLFMGIYTTACNSVGSAQNDSDRYLDTNDTGQTDSDTTSGTETETETDSAPETDSDTGTETETDTDLLECMEWHHDCTECYGDCEDGFWYELYFPQDAADSDAFIDVWVSPTDDLEDISLTWYNCSVCGNCGGERKIRESAEQEWRPVSAREFCEFLSDYQSSCSDCLVRWAGGGGK